MTHKELTILADRAYARSRNFFDLKASGKYSRHLEMQFLEEAQKAWGEGQAYYVVMLDNCSKDVLTSLRNYELAVENLIDHEGKN
ncbi:MAG: hypothetical protein LC650_02615 [Actinobacteria bacterium]|nr:hypothetical protein [Actinomycetota bacterium]